MDADEIVDRIERSIVHDLQDAHYAIEKLEAENARLREALVGIRNHPHNSYPEPGAESEYARQYEIGVADGHRCAAAAARRALEADDDE